MQLTTSLWLALRAACGVQIGSPADLVGVMQRRVHRFVAGHPWPLFTDSEDLRVVIAFIGSHARGTSSMKTLPVLLAVLLTSGAFAQAIGFSHVTLLDGGSELMIYRTSGRGSPATKFQGQSGFDKPAISPDRRYVGWLVLQSGLGASYAEPTGLAVEGDRGNIHQFAGSWGMVFGWCFATEPNAVTFMYSFPHGITPVDFETVRISDGKVLRHFELSPSQIDKVVDAAAPPELPLWARCAWASAYAQ